MHNKIPLCSKSVRTTALFYSICTNSLGLSYCPFAHVANHKHNIQKTGKEASSLSSLHPVPPCSLVASTITVPNVPFQRYSIQTRGQAYFFFLPTNDNTQCLAPGFLPYLVWIRNLLYQYLEIFLFFKYLDSVPLYCAIWLVPNWWMFVSNLCWHN